MSMWEGLNRNRNLQTSRIYFQPGQYLVRLTCVKEIRAENSFHRRGSFIVEAEIVESNVSSLPPGTIAAWVQTMKNEAVAFPAINSFFAAVLKTADLSQVNMEELVTQCVSAANPLAGVMLRLQCAHKPTKAGTMFTVHNWSPLQ